jgi:hypothetical protein
VAALVEPVVRWALREQVDRQIESSKIVHVALLLLMLEALNADLAFIISLKRSTQHSRASRMAV